MRDVTEDTSERLHLKIDLTEEPEIEYLGCDDGYKHNVDSYTDNSNNLSRNILHSFLFIFSFTQR